MQEVWSQISHAVVEEFSLPKIVIGFFGVAILAFGAFARKQLIRFVGKLLEGFRRTSEAKRRLDRVRKAISSETGSLWLAPHRDGHAFIRPDNYDDATPRSRVLTVANLKGGVGKSTIAANLAAYFALFRNERVLAIDLDFQGSLSGLLISDPNLRLPPAADVSLASKLVSEERSAHWLIEAKKTALPRMGPLASNRVSVVPAFYDLATTEVDAMVRWLIGDDEHDLRYRLARLFADPFFRQNIDRVIIDTPPRLSTGTIQALAASSHVLIPTALDALSAEAVGSFFDILESRRQIWPHLRVIGVVGSMTENNIGRKIENDPDTPQINHLALAEREGFSLIQRQISAYAPNLNLNLIMPFECFIQDLGAISKFAAAGPILQSNLATDADAAAMFQRLGEEVALRMS